jgi:hypothetical protein
MNHQQLGYSDGDVDTNRSANPTLQGLIDIRYSRRQTLSGLAASAAAFMGTSLLSACGDDSGNSSETPLQVTVGQTAQTSSGRPVVLVGSTSFDVPTVRFEQVSGPAVTLTNAGTSSASFLAPSVSSSTPLVFRFTGTDFAGRTASTETTVTVAPAQLGFAAVPKNLNDIVTVPAGYTATVLYRLGDPIKAGASSYANNGSDTDFASRAGDHHDALYYYGLSAAGARDDNASSRGLLVMNHENITQA